MEIKPFKRINFFTGFITTADDWNAAENYHNEKRRLHNSHLHSPGIVPDYIDCLVVEVAKDEKHMYVGAGCAIDAQGRELLLPERKTVLIELENFKLGQMIYVVIRYQEEMVIKQNFQANLNQEYEGYKFIEEKPIISIDAVEPRPDDGVELARIKLSNSGKISNKDIDTSYVRVAGARVSLRNSSFILLKHSESSLSRGQIDPVPIERVKLNEPKGVYFVNAFPSKGSGRISWEIEAVTENDELSYELHFNIKEGDIAKIAYQVYKLM